MDSDNVRDELEEKRMAGAKKVVARVAKKMGAIVEKGLDEIGSEKALQDKIASFGANEANGALLGGPGIVIGFAARRLVDFGWTIDQVVHAMEEMASRPATESPWLAIRAVTTNGMPGFHHCGAGAVLPSPGQDLPPPMTAEEVAIWNATAETQRQTIALGEQALRCLYVGFQEILAALAQGVDIPQRGGRDVSPAYVDAVRRSLAYIRFTLEIYSSVFTPQPV